MAIDLADRLMPAFETPDGLPFPRVNLRHGVEENEVKECCTAGGGSLILEFGMLSRISGVSKYEDAAKRALLAILDRRSNLGLIGNTMFIFEKNWRDDSTVIFMLTL